jgi:hypothetical protein
MNFGDLFLSSNAVTVGAWSFVVGLTGLCLTLAGLYLTYREATRARTAAEAADRAVDRFRFRASQYESYRDASEAAYALDVTKRHLNNDAWTDAGQSYEDARRALVRIRNNAENLDDDTLALLNTMIDQMVSFCNAVDSGLAGKRKLPEKPKALAAIRNNHDRIVIVQHMIQKGI